MKIWPTAPQAAKAISEGVMDGLRDRNVKAEVSSDAEASVPGDCLGLMAREVMEGKGMIGERRRKDEVRSVERTFCATIIWGPVYER